MDAKPSLINQLLDVIENLLIENRAYVAAVKQLAPDAQRLADQLIAMAKNDPRLRTIIHEQFSAFRNLSPEQVLQEIVKQLETKKDVN